MGLTEAQRAELGKIEHASAELERHLARSSGAAASELAQQWSWEDVALADAPLTALRQAPGNDLGVAAAPNATVTVNFKTACLKLTVVDRTSFPIGHVESEIWSQALAETDADGKWRSPVFLAGKYALKLRRGAITAPLCPPHTPVVGREFSLDVEFIGGILEMSCSLAINAGALELGERAVQILRRAWKQARGVLKEQLEALISPASIGTITGLLALWVAGHFVGVSEVVDAIMAVGAAALVGLDFVISVVLAREIVAFGKLAAFPEDEFDLQEAGRLLDDIAVQFIPIGVAKLFELLAGVVTRFGSNREPGVAPEARPEEGSPRPAEGKPADDDAAGEGGKDDTESPRAAAARRLASEMGAEVYARRLKEAREALEAHPAYKGLTPEQAAVLRGYTEKNVETELARMFPQFRRRGKPLGDFAVINGLLRTQDAAGMGKLPST